jgi:hypothetical protein
MSLLTLIVSANGEYIMLKTLLITSTVLIAASSLAQASMPLFDNSNSPLVSNSIDQENSILNLFADSGHDDNDSDGHDSSGHDDNGGHDANDDSNDDNGSNDSRCDSAHDIAEHAGCRT